MKDLCVICEQEVPTDDENVVDMPDLNGGQDGLVAHADCVNNLEPVL
jgi:hypothetical protein